LATTWSAIFATSLDAHEFIIKPAQLQVDTGAKLPFNVLATHVFMVGEEVEPVKTVKTSVIEGEKTTPVDITENNTLETLDGVVTLNRMGTAVLVAHLQEPIESIKVDGTSRSQRIKREKFAKALITVGTDDDSYKKVLGHKLEIVPVANVMKAKTSDEVTFKILLNGKPVKSQVYATYDGFSRRYMTFAYATESRDDGLAHVKVGSAGTWMVRVEKRLEGNAKDYDVLSLKATLVFLVQ
jgi:uncharacterized GH25 family protein